MKCKPLRWARLNTEHPLVRGLIGCWIFNEGVGDIAHDSSPSHNNGSISSLSGWVAGPYGATPEFDGNSSYISVPYNSLYDVTIGLSIAAWVYPQSVPDDAGQILHRRENNIQDPNWANLYRLSWESSGAFRFNIFNGTTWGGCISNGGKSTNSWYFVAGVFNGDNEYIYVDAVKEGTGTNSGSIPASTHGFNIGKEWNDQNYFDGYISDVRMWNRALSEADIMWLYNDPYDMFRQPSPTKYFYVSTGGISIPVVMDSYRRQIGV